MVICEAHRINAWKALAGGCQLLTVEKCLEEAATGDSSRPGYIEVDVEKIRKDFVIIFDPGRREQAELVLRLPGDIQLDPGERHLLAAARRDSEPWILCGPDRAAFRALSALGFMDRMVSLEELLGEIGIRNSNLKRNYRKQWVSDCRTQFLLEEDL